MDIPTGTWSVALSVVILGTAAYTSPEQAKGKRTGIWAFGEVA